MFTKTIDPLGSLSKFGMVQEASLTAFTDFTLTTQRGEELTIEEVKALVDVSEAGQIRARYGVVQFPISFHWLA
jgi:hypothetical protein